MSYRYPYSEKINLFVKKRIAETDAKRQENTAREILRRLENQPGVILADEVGMGKTFVALAVAASVALFDKNKRPVVIMVPPSLKEKWPRDFELFREKCIPEALRQQLQAARAENAVDFLKLLDDPLSRRKQIIFLTHGAMKRGLDDAWVKAALIYRALYKRKNTDNLKRALCRITGRLFHMSQLDRHYCDMWNDLFSHDPAVWLDILHKYKVDPEGDENPSTDDDPVPKTIRNELDKLNTDPIYEALKSMPYNQTKYFDSKLREARWEINAEIKTLWKHCIKSLRYQLPLLILDEAHHLKNPETRLASLFWTEEARDDADEISKGELGGVFERMLFLTATPFQLGHYELCSVLERFSGISWSTNDAFSGGKKEFLLKINMLSARLDAAQEAAIRLDQAWGKLRKEHLTIDSKEYTDVESWWKVIEAGNNFAPEIQTVIVRYREAKKEMLAVQEFLHPWVIRHMRDKHLPPPFEKVNRRLSFVGRAILEENEGPEMPGLLVDGNALLPFLLAARATACNPERRPIFAEGLASSYEAFLYTRRLFEKKIENRLTSDILDSDDESIDISDVDKFGNWYLDRLESLIPLNEASPSVLHPKVAATVKRALELWLKGEKILIFCHYIATGRVVRQHVSAAIQEEITKLGSQKLKCSSDQVFKELDRIGKRFFDKDSPLRLACDGEVEKILSYYPKLKANEEPLKEIIRRYLRTPSFLVRYLPLEEKHLTKETMVQAFEVKDESELSLRGMLDYFFRFLVERCSEIERNSYIDALSRMQPGSHVGADVEKTFTDDEVQGDAKERLIPNVRLVNGQAKQETRQRLMLTFNTPFYPEVLIASSVMAEGVDLHLNCRHVIHHDLCWNPSTLEQRTGRVDRIGAKVERCGKPIHIYLPYIAATQDEKMYRVVMDRERWFKFVMGEEFKIQTTAKTTEKIAERIPLPSSIAEELAFKLDI